MIKDMKQNRTRALLEKVLSSISKRIYLLKQMEFIGNPICLSHVLSRFQQFNFMKIGSTPYQAHSKVLSWGIWYFHSVFQCLNEDCQSVIFLVTRCINSAAGGITDFCLEGWLKKGGKGGPFDSSGSLRRLK